MQPRFADELRSSVRHSIQEDTAGGAVTRQPTHWRCTGKGVCYQEDQKKQTLLGIVAPGGSGDCCWQALSAMSLFYYSTYVLICQARSMTKCSMTVSASLLAAQL
jgi:hypothetical protein